MVLHFRYFFPIFIQFFFQFLCVPLSVSYHVNIFSMTWGIGLSDKNTGRQYNWETRLNYVYRLNFWFDCDCWRLESYEWICLKNEKIKEENKKKTKKQIVYSITRCNDSIRDVKLLCSESNWYYQPSHIQSPDQRNVGNMNIVHEIKSHISERIILKLIKLYALNTDTDVIDENESQTSK